jgi:hypothetical protein
VARDPLAPERCTKKVSPISDPTSTPDSLLLRTFPLHQAGSKKSNLQFPEAEAGLLLIGVMFRHMSTWQRHGKVYIQEAGKNTNRTITYHYFLSIAQHSFSQRQIPIEDNILRIEHDLP